MKSLFLGIISASLFTSFVSNANEGIDAYRMGNYNKAGLLLNSQSSPDPESAYYEAQMRLYGYGLLKNNLVAFKLFKKAADLGHFDAMYLLATVALQNNQPEEAIAWFKKAADKHHDLNATKMIAAAYLYGYGVKRNKDMAKRYIIQAAKQGDSIAQTELAADFLNSKHTTNKKLGLLWLNKALAQNNPRAQVLMAQELSKSTSPQALKEATKFAEAAVAQHYIPAWIVLGDLEKNNINESRRFYLMAAKEGNSEAQLALGKTFVNDDKSQYFLWVLKSAQNGNNEAQKLLANLYKTGEGTSTNQDLADQWLKKSKSSNLTNISPNILVANWLTNNKHDSILQAGYAAKGILSPWQNNDALKENNYNPAPMLATITRQMLYTPQFVLATPNSIPMSELYKALQTREPIVRLPLVDYSANFKDETTSFIQPIYKSRGISDSERFAKKLNAATLGDPEAQFDVAQYYQKGYGVKQNYTEALKYYSYAAAQQSLPAEYNLAMMYLRGEGVESNHKMAIDLLKDAAFKGDPHAQYALGLIEEQGIADGKGKWIVKPNLSESQNMYFIASSNDFGPAQFRLARLLLETPSDTVAAENEKIATIKSLYQGAVKNGIKEAKLPLAFYDAMAQDNVSQRRAFEVAIKAAEEGNPEGALLLGLLLDRGIGTPANPEAAMNWYEKAKDTPVKSFILGTYYSQKEGNYYNPDQGASLLNQAASANFSYANLNLAILNHARETDFLSPLQKALALGNSQAGLLLADYYLSQANDISNMKHAKEIYQQFAEKGDKNAALKLAFMYDEGLGIQSDKLEAQKWYTVSAEQGIPEAQYLLGRLYQMGWVSPKPDYEMAKEWFSRSKEKFVPSAIALGFIYDTVDNDYVKALEQYTFAANKDDPVGEYNLALLYDEGKGIKPDFEKAKSLYSVSAEQGNDQAMVQLGEIYFNGTHIAKDEDLARQWFEKAALRRNRDALYQLGVMAETGVSVNQDYTKAKQYYQDSAGIGNAKATLALARMYQFGLGVEKDTQKAASLYKILAERDNAYAQYQLATMYFNGALGKISADQGKKLLNLAADNGNSKARIALQLIRTQNTPFYSYIEPIVWNNVPKNGEQPAARMFFNAMNDWNRGEEESTLSTLEQLMSQYPNYTPAKETRDKILTNQSTKLIS